MEIDFTQIYAEIGTSFRLSGSLLELLADQLNGLRKEMPGLRKECGGKDFAIVFIISATRKNKVIQVKGPHWPRKTREAEFVVYVPYKTFSSFDEKISYVLSQVAQGIVDVFDRYGSDSAGIADAVAKVAEIFRRNPESYRSESDDTPVRRH